MMGKDAMWAVVGDLTWLMKIVEGRKPACDVAEPSV